MVVHSGGAHLTPLGHAIVTHYRAIESKAAKAAASHIAALQEAVATTTPASLSD